MADDSGRDRKRRTGSLKRQSEGTSPTEPERLWSAREAALFVLGRVSGKGAFAEIVLDEELDRVKPRDKALATELVYGALRHMGRIDWVIGKYSSVKIAKLERRVLNTLRIGAYQLLLLTGVPPRAAINETVELVKGKGGREGAKKAGFVNAVLRRISSERESIAYPEYEADPVEHISIVYSHPKWLVRRWISRFGPAEALELCRAGVEVPPRTIRANTLVTTRERLAGELREEGFTVAETVFSPHGLIVKGGGPLDPGNRRYYIQDEGSQLVSLLVAPSPNEAVMDACAAPGGKTTHLAGLMENRGMVYAVDKHHGRLKSVSLAARRLGADIVSVIAADAERPLTLPSHLKEGFDAILLDAPCTGLGVLRRTPDIKLKRTEEDIAKNSRRQARMIENLSGYVKKGGRLIYSVCTFEPEETDSVVERFLEGHPEFYLEDAGEILPPACKPLVDKKGLLRTFPHRHSTDGFFAARLGRKV